VRAGGTGHKSRVAPFLAAEPRFTSTPTARRCHTRARSRLRSTSPPARRSKVRSPTRRGWGDGRAPLVRFRRPTHHRLPVLCSTHPAAPLLAAASP